MENNNYFAEMMKSPMPHEQERSAALVYIDELLNEILFKQEKQRLMAAIDQSLDQNDRSAFIQLSNQLIQLEQSFKS
ncbi:IDEAL domain-containing protein [Bacillus xiapuensis]|uniref:IDEAL domain-containing protein n=1 Tax=Bacillus xiapuensis TaxID=2014075 RepID=UPI000C240344|nr:IDEAL domain-containing protein [Bacillus xiapuensis]